MDKLTEHGDAVAVMVALHSALHGEPLQPGEFTAAMYAEQFCDGELNRANTDIKRGLGAGLIIKTRKALIDGSWRNVYTCNGAVR